MKSGVDHKVSNSVFESGALPIATSVEMQDVVGGGTKISIVLAV